MIFYYAVIAIALIMLFQLFILDMEVQKVFFNVSILLMGSFVLVFLSFLILLFIGKENDTINYYAIRILVLNILFGFLWFFYDDKKEKRKKRTIIKDEEIEHLEKKLHKAKKDKEFVEDKLANEENKKNAEYKEELKRKIKETETDKIEIEGKYKLIEKQKEEDKRTEFLEFCNESIKKTKAAKIPEGITAKLIDHYNILSKKNFDEVGSNFVESESLENSLKKIAWGWFNEAVEKLEIARQENKISEVVFREKTSELERYTNSQIENILIKVKNH